MQIKIALLFLFITQLGWAQSAKYKIRSSGIYLGDMSVHKTESNGIININITSDVIVKLFLTIDLQYRLNCIYKNKELTYGSVTTYVNGAKHSSIITQKNGSDYTINQNDHSSKYMKIINYSGGLLYFDEPTGQNYLYSEFNGYDKQIKTLGRSKYLVTDTNSGHKSTYQYKNGVLTLATVEHTLMTFTMTKY